MLYQNGIKIIFKLYQWGVGPMLHLWAGGNCGCRFNPTCSNYAQNALIKEGLFRGLVLSIKRVLRCHPWGKEGANG